MGFSADAHLIFGIPVSSHDDDGEPTRFWNEEGEDWIDFAEEQLRRDGIENPWNEIPDDTTNAEYEEFRQSNPAWEQRKEQWYDLKAKAEATINVELQHYGHYDSYDGQRAILTPKRCPSFRGDCWEPTHVPNDLSVSDKALSKANDCARFFGLDVDFYGDAGWNLVASYG